MRGCRGEGEGVWPAVGEFIDGDGISFLVGGGDGFVYVETSCGGGGGQGSCRCGGTWFFGDERRIFFFFVVDDEGAVVVGCEEEVLGAW